MTDFDAMTAAAAAGDATALETIYGVLAPMVRGYLSVRGSRDADGLTSEVFLDVIPRLGDLCGGWAGLRTLTFSVAHARLVDERRQRGRRPDTRPYDPVTDGLSAPSAEDGALSRLASEELVALLALLPEVQREVVVLRVLADLTVAQTARVLGLSQPTVKKAQAKALSTLRALLAPMAPTANGRQGLA